MPRAIAVLGGTGPEGFGLALRWARAGESVIIGSRDAGRAREAAAKILAAVGGSAKVSGEENVAACAATDLLMLTIPFEGHCGLLKQIRPSSFLLHWIQSPWCQTWIGRASGATAQAHFYISDTKRMPVPLPPEDEQSVIVDEVDRCLSIMSAAESQIEHGLLRAARLRQSILKRAFEGKLVPQDPTDERADKLLERIKAERNGNMKGAKPSRTRPGGRVSQSRPLEK